MSQETTISERVMGVAALASLTAGLVAGIGARIIMRIVALTSHMPPQFSIGGTLIILLNGIFIGFAAGFLIITLTIAVSASTKARKYLPGPVWRGLIWGLLLFLVVGPPLFLSSSFPNTDISFGIPLLNKSMFGALIIIYGLTLVLLPYLLRRALVQRLEKPSPL